jgi:hypothetical protein
VAVSVISLRDVMAMTPDEWAGWHRFLKNHLQRLNVTAKARAKR